MTEAYQSAPLQTLVSVPIRERICGGVQSKKAVLTQRLGQQTLEPYSDQQTKEGTIRRRFRTPHYMVFCNSGMQLVSHGTADSDFAAFSEW